MSEVLGENHAVRFSDKEQKLHLELICSALLENVEFPGVKMD